MESRVNELFEAIQSRNIERIKVILKENTDIAGTPNSVGYYPIAEAVISDDLDILKIFLSLNSAVQSINKKDPNGRTSVHYATEPGRLEMLKLLFENGGDRSINEQDYDGDTPLHHAVIFNNIEAETFLLRNGADINIRNEQGLTPLELKRCLEKLRELKSMYEGKYI